jgi:hypothetical protein
MAIPVDEWIIKTTVVQDNCYLFDMPHELATRIQKRDSYGLEQMNVKENNLICFEIVIQYQCLAPGSI